MKDNLFEMLLSLFEQTLTQLKESHATTTECSPDAQRLEATTSTYDLDSSTAFFKSAHSDSIRVFTVDEQMKLTKASYQFLVRIASWGILGPDVFELIINQLIFSDSRYVSLQETKWTIRSTLANSLDAEQLAFLDLVLYHKEDGLPLH
jgi:uncharacterized protein Smg (DUF494 family)